MTTNLGNVVYTQGQGSVSTASAYPVISASASPTSNTVNPILYPVGKIWVNKSANTVFILTSYTSSQGVISANWEPLGGSGGDGTFNSITTDGANANGYGVEVDMATSGSDAALGIINSSNTAGSDAIANIYVAGSSGGDAQLTVGITSGQTYSFGLDNSASDALVLCSGTALGTTNFMSVSTAGAGSWVAGDWMVTRSSAGADVTVEATNSDNTSGTSNAYFEAAVGGASSGDAGVRFQISGGQAYSMAIDNSASDALVIAGSNNPGTTNMISISTAGVVSVVLEDLIVTRANAGGNVQQQVINTDNTSGTSNATQYASVGGASAGDPRLRLLVTGATTWDIGVDNSVSDQLCINPAGTIGSGDAVQITTAGLTTFALGDVYVSRANVGGTVSGLIYNSDNSSGSSHAVLQISTGGASAGDAQIIQSLTGSTVWSFGVDNSASDAWVLSQNASLGTSNALSVSTALDVTASSGNFVIATSGKKLNYTNFAANTATAVANSFGTTTLIAGTITVTTTAVTANSYIALSRQSVGATGANDLGFLTVGTIVAGTSFVINSWTVTNATALQTDDVSTVLWQIFN